MEFNKETFCVIGAGCGIFSAIAMIADGVYNGVKYFSAKKAEKEIREAKEMASDKE